MGKSTLESFRQPEKSQKISLPKGVWDLPDPGPPKSSEKKVRKVKKKESISHFFIFSLFCRFFFCSELFGGPVSAGPKLLSGDFFDTFRGFGVSVSVDGRGDPMGLYQVNGIPTLGLPLRLGMTIARNMPSACEVLLTDRPGAGAQDGQGEDISRDGIQSGDQRCHGQKVNFPRGAANCTAKSLSKRPKSLKKPPPLRGALRA